MIQNAPTTTVRVRFAPSPTGYLHIGGARTVLFNWLLARKSGGTFVLRIEDTDRTRHVEDSVQKILDDLRWLGLAWDEGPEVGGPFGPYSQSERLDLYNEHLDRLLEAGTAYYALETPEQLRAMREAAEKTTGGFRYPRPEPLPTLEEGRAARAEGRSAAVRFKMPDKPITVTDEILGEVTLQPDQLEDFVIQKSDGYPTYHFACVVDDELMRITHVLRGQEHLMNTPKHIALQRALGFRTPRFAHLPVIFNIDGSKMSKRDKEKAIKQGRTPPEIDVHDFRVAGYLPEAVLNFIALLGWSAGDDREQYTLDELVEAFTLARVGKANARFDRDKLISFNTDRVAAVTEDRLLEAFKDFLAVQPSKSQNVETSKGSSEGISTFRRFDVFRPTGKPPTEHELAAVLRACAGMRTFPDVLKKAGFLFTPDEEIEFDPRAVKKVLTKNESAGYAMLEALLPKLEALPEWTAEAIEAFIKAICEEREIGMGGVAQPLRVAITGATVSPAIGVSLELLGRPSTMVRIRRCLTSRS